jgi:lipoprotein-anchoring transpeptidase ErfK/SrfK
LAASTAAAVLLAADCANAQFFDSIFSPPAYRGYRYDPYGPRPYAAPRVTAPPAAHYQRPKRKAADVAKKEPAVKPPPGPLLIAISINRQRLTLYSNGAPIAHSPVSTGTATHPTPTGIFSVIGKSRFHRSNLYSNAPMPFMQRLTWSGVALHQGVLPGYPASHGCIRLPGDFAQYLFGVTRMGARIIVTRDEPAPFEIAHANLFTPKPKASEEPVESTRPAGQVQAKSVKIAESEYPATSSDALNPAQAAVLVAGTPLKGALDAHAPDPVASAKAAERDTVAPMPAAGRRMAGEISDAIGTPPASAAAPSAVADSVSKPGRASTAEMKDKPKMSEPVSVFVSRKAGRLYVRQGFEPLFDMPVTIRDADKPLGTHLYTAMEFTADRAAMRWVAVALPTQAAAEPVSPRGRKKAAAIEVVERPAAPMSVQLAAANALDRVEMPKEAVDRISDLLSPGSSLIISDYPISGETGKHTDFIILTR